MQERWNEIRELLRQARPCLPPRPEGASCARVPVGLLAGTSDEFEEFLVHNELELAWDALAAFAERTGAAPVCWHKLAQAANLMELTNKEALAAKHAMETISSDRVLKIAREDAETVYRDLTPFRIVLALEPDGWHVDYELKNPNLNGGGPHYVINPVTGAILSKQYEQ